MKKILSIILAALIITSFSGCGGGKNEKQPDEAGNITYVTQKKDSEIKDKEENQKSPSGKAISLEEVMKAPETPENRFTYFDNGNGCTILSYEGNDEIIVLPDKIEGMPVTEITDRIFMNDRNIKAIKFNDSLTFIADRIFLNAEALQIAVLGKNIKTVEEDAFLNCPSLHTVILNDGLENINTSAFGNCGKIKEIKIPASVTFCDFSVFIGCPEEFTIKGEKGSYIEGYAKENGRPFEAE